ARADLNTCEPVVVAQIDQLSSIPLPAHLAAAVPRDLPLTTAGSRKTLNPDVGFVRFVRHVREPFPIGRHATLRGKSSFCGRTGHDSVRPRAAMYRRASQSEVHVGRLQECFLTLISLFLCFLVSLKDFLNKRAKSVFLTSILWL